MKLCIGVIVYNPDRLVLERIENYKEVCDKIILYDNSEVINSVSRELSKKYEYYISDKNNNGLSMAIDYFFCKSIDFKCDVLLTMDQDSDFSNDNIRKMMRKIQEDDDDHYAIYCPNYKKVYLDKYKNKILGSPKITIGLDKDVDFSMTSGSFYKLKFHDYFYPINDLFIGYVDHEICFNVLKNNKKIKMIGEIIFNQEVGDLVTNSFYNRKFHVVRHKELRYEYMFRNNFFLTERFKSNHLIRKKLEKDRVRLLINIFLGGKKTK